MKARSEESYVGKLVAWMDPSGFRRVAICTGTTIKPSLNHQPGRYLICEVAGRVRYLDLDNTEVEVVGEDHVHHSRQA
jgi:hypothetical protein